MDDLAIASEMRAIADRIEALMPHLDWVARFAPAIQVDAYRANARKYERKATAAFAGRS